MEAKNDIKEPCETPEHHCIFHGLFVIVQFLHSHVKSSRYNDEKTLANTGVDASECEGVTL